MTSPALLLASIAGTGLMLGGIIAWARGRQRRKSVEAARTSSAKPITQR